jgi:hypothetical protein
MNHAATALALAVALQAQPAPGGQGGGWRAGNRGAMAGRAMQLLYIERAFALVCFELGMTDEQLLKARPLFQAAWESRKAALAGLQGGDPAGMALKLSEANDRLRQDIEDGLTDVLTEEQRARFDELMSRPPPGLPFGGGGWRGPGGAAPAANP